MKDTEQPVVVAQSTTELLKWRSVNEGGLETMALDLKRQFQDQRQQAKLDARKAGSTETDKDGRYKDYAPLNLSCRIHKGTLEITWYELHRKGGVNRHRYITKGRGPDYDMTKLLASAKPFELEIVRDTEEKARVLRRLWTLHTKARAIDRQFADEIGLVRPQSGAVSQDENFEANFSQAPVAV